MDARAEAIRIQTRAEAEIDVLRRAFLVELQTLLKRRIAERNGVYDVTTYALLRQDLDRLLNAYYGAYPGDERGKFLQLLFAQIRRVALLPARRIAAMKEARNASQK